MKIRLVGLVCWLFDFEFNLQEYRYLLLRCFADQLGINCVEVVRWEFILPFIQLVFIAIRN